MQEPAKPGELGRQQRSGKTGQTPQPFQLLGEAQGKERRTSPRRAFQYRQLVAPVHHGLMPGKHSFVEVTCEDISAGGIAFYLDKLPDFKDLVVALGHPPELTYFAARIARTVEQVREGRTYYLIGCRFTGRVHL